MRSKCLQLKRVKIWHPRCSTRWIPCVVEALQCTSLYIGRPLELWSWMNQPAVRLLGNEPGTPYRSYGCPAPSWRCAKMFPRTSLWLRKIRYWTLSPTG